MTQPVETPAELAERLRLPFGSDLRLLTRALTHRSYVNEHPNTPQDNERLEFLGDAVLDFVVGAWLYQHFPEMHEGDLTRMRSALVRTESLARFASDIELGRAVRLGRGELSGGGGARPAILCATFEALIGAIYLQLGLDAARAFVLPMLERTADELLQQPDVDVYDAKSRLQERTQAEGRGIPRYVTVGTTGPDHARVFEMAAMLAEEELGRGSGTSRQAAMQAAAQNALNRLDGLL